MASVALLFMLLLHLHLLAASTSAQPADDHHERCKTSHCGDVEIPCPFGLIGGGCAIDKSFDTNCSRSAADGVYRPFISRMQVLDISVSRGETRALMHTPYYCYNDTSGEIRGSYSWTFNGLHRPYLFSEARNRFVVIGCNTLAYMYGNHSSGGGAVDRSATGCPTVCGSPEFLVNGSCSGVGCCESAVPQGLANYNIYFYDVHYYVNVDNSWRFPCSYVALLEVDTFVFRSEYATTPGRFNESDGGRRPVVLEWTVGGNATCEAASAAGTSACRANTVCDDSLNGPGYRCNCSSGYEGNPYLPAGCTDVNECQSSSSPCPKSATCQNTLGGYQCSCPFGRKFVNETNSCTSQLLDQSVASTPYLLSEAALTLVSYAMYL